MAIFYSKHKETTPPSLSEYRKIILSIFRWATVFFNPLRYYKKFDSISEVKLIPYALRHVEMCPSGTGGEMMGCYNGGSCVMNDTEAYECKCRDDYQGEHCQFRESHKVHVHWENAKANSFLWYLLRLNVNIKLDNLWRRLEVTLYSLSLLLQ